MSDLLLVVRRDSYRQPSDNPFLTIPGAYRTPDEYVAWIHNVAKECGIDELEILDELLAKPENCDRKIFVDANISVETLHKISDEDHVLVMLSDPEIGIHRFFDRPDREKQFLYQLSGKS